MLTKVGGSRKLTGAKLHPLGVFLASADKAEQAALRLFCEQQGAVYFTGAADDVRGVCCHIEESGADLLIMDWELPRGGGNHSGAESCANAEDVIEYLKERLVDLRIILLTRGRRHEGAALAAGANFVICKDQPAEQVIELLKEAIEVCRGELSNSGEIS
jgi:DNA-binding NarL/FixJ family response regulator